MALHADRQSTASPCTDTYTGFQQQDLEIGVRIVCILPFQE